MADHVKKYVVFPKVITNYQEFHGYFRIKHKKEKCKNVLKNVSIF